MQNINFKYADIGTMAYDHGAIIIKISQTSQLFSPYSNQYFIREICIDFIYKNMEVL